MQHTLSNKAITKINTLTTDIKTAFKTAQTINLPRYSETLLTRYDALLDQDQINLEDLLAELENIDTVLSNPFIYTLDNEDVYTIKAIRNSLTQIILDGMQNDAKFLTAFQHSEKMRKLYLQIIACNPLKLELDKIVAQNNIPALIKRIDQLLTTTTGLIKFKNMVQIDYKNIITLLKECIGYQEEFSQFATSVIQEIPARTRYILSQDDVRIYQEKKLPLLLQTNKGRNQIINDITMLIELTLLHLDTMHTIISENNTMSIDTLQKTAKNKIEKQINEAKRNFLK